MSMYVATSTSFSEQPRRVNVDLKVDKVYIHFKNSDIMLAMSLEYAAKFAVRILEELAMAQDVSFADVVLSTTEETPFEPQTENVP